MVCQLVSHNLFNLSLETLNPIDFKLGALIYLTVLWVKVIFMPVDPLFGGIMFLSCLSVFDVHFNF